METRHPFWTREASNEGAAAAAAPGRAPVAGRTPASLPAPVLDLEPEADDAFGTLMAWLHSRIAATR
ncbi:hypothetical protein D9Q98_009092 [Chlorella vulgaris]|uniref:Uncharacterized protein n=1 Tax=Chlorella vulgaris TaxID=3077 RepID=A0A9D4THB5_CHLVU|nr:hypothetical protein D9Q98_009092 [Chlorella vulgaris]